MINITTQELSLVSGGNPRCVCQSVATGEKAGQVETFFTVDGAACIEKCCVSENQNRANYRWTWFGYTFYAKGTC